jgi:hypothetical protein
MITVFPAARLKIVFVSFYFMFYLFNISNGINSSTHYLPREHMPPCKPSAPCSLKVFPTGDFLPPATVDNSRKVLMEWVPKSDSSNAIAMFYADMGYHYGKHYDGFSHNFNRDYFIPNCGKRTVCMYLDPSWYRFKIVRNPYERAVSSYLHCVKNQGLPAKVFPDQESVTFKDFVYWIKKIPRDDFPNYCGYGHFRVQTTLYERHCFVNQMKLFHEIVYSEDPLPAIQRINDKVGTNYTLRGTDYAILKTRSHSTTKNDTIQTFTGKKSYRELKDSVPSYKYFYNQDLYNLISSIYGPDILIYNYSFPWPELGLKPFHVTLDL